MARRIQGCTRWRLRWKGDGTDFRLCVPHRNAAICMVIGRRFATGRHPRPRVTCPPWHQSLTAIVVRSCAWPRKTVSFDIRQHRYAIAAENHGNFYRAARALGVEQSTLSRATLKLERSIGMPIFECARVGITSPVRGSVGAQRR